MPLSLRVFINLITYVINFSYWCVNNLLKAHPIELKINVNGTRKNAMIGNEHNKCVVHSVALFMAPGCETCIVVTNKRDDLFDVG